MLSFPHFSAVTLLCLALFLFFLRRWRRNHAPTRRKILPPSPRKLLVIGNLHQLGLFPHRSLRSLSRRYGHLMLLHFGRVPVLVVSSANAAREIMKSQDLIFSNRPKSRIADGLFYGSRDVAFSPYGAYWKQIRSICVLQLLSVKKVQSFRCVREEETSLMVEKISRLGASSAVINLSQMVVSLTNDVICRVALGRKYSVGDEGEKFRKMLREVGVLLGTFCIGDYIPWLSWIDRLSGLEEKIQRVFEETDEFFESVVEEHRRLEKAREILETESEITSSNFVNILLQVGRENAHHFLADNEAIKAIIFDMFAAGTDTTSAALEWTMAELIRNPRTMKILQNEVREVAGNKKEVDEDDLEKMPYLKAVIKESLRLHPPVPLLVPRESTRDTKVMGYEVAAGTQVIVNSWSIARDRSLWEDPDDFRPERFLNTGIDFRGHHFELIPFGAGRRGCPGLTFAVAVNELALAKLVQKFDFDLPDGARKLDLDMAEDSGIGVRKKFPLLVVAKNSSIAGY